MFPYRTTLLLYIDRLQDEGYKMRLLHKYLVIQYHQLKQWVCLDSGLDLVILLD